MNLRNVLSRNFELQMISKVDRVTKTRCEDEHGRLLNFMSLWEPRSSNWHINFAGASCQTVDRELLVQCRVKGVKSVNHYDVATSKTSCEDRKNV